MINISDFTAAERAALYRAIRLRRDVRSHFLPDDVPDELLMRVLEAAHSAPSVGLAQPWRFIIVRSAAARTAVHAGFCQANAAAARLYSGVQAEKYRNLRLQGILDAPINICVVCEDAPLRGHGLGRQSMPETTRYSTVCAIQNLWLAARVEGLGVGWVSIIDPQLLRTTFSIPERLSIIAYLCMGFVSDFAGEPDLVRAAWETRMPLADVVHYERYEQR